MLLHARRGLHTVPSYTRVTAWALYPFLRLQHYALINGGDWRAYATWDEGKYVRHLVWCNDDVEIMVGRALVAMCRSAN